MKVLDLVADENQLHFILEPEHPAEIALLKLADGCEARCGIPPSESVPGGLASDVGLSRLPEVKLRVSVNIKKQARGY